MPHTIDLKNTVAEARNTYLYAADGRKLKTTHQWNSNPSASAVAGSAVTASALNQTSTTDYVQNKVYENGTLSRVLIDGGYIEGTTYHFYITDHLGSTRTVANSSGTVIQQNKYYPFGAHFADNLQTEQEKQPYKYNGKELDNKRGLNLYDYHARQYDPAIARFLTMDPLAEKYYSWSPYAYCLNNPMRFVDKDGQSPGDVVVAFAGADLYSDGGLGVAPQIIQKIQPTLDQYGGVGQAFKSQFWGTNLSKPGNAHAFDKATQKAYDYVLENHNMHDGEQVEGGRIFIQGYSYGGVMANHLAKRLQAAGIDVELLITVDAAAGPYSDKIDRTVPSNVKKNINYYQTQKSDVKSRGGKNKAEDNNSTIVYNINLTSIGDHSTLNELTKDMSASRILHYLKERIDHVTDAEAYNY